MTEEEARALAREVIAGKARSYVQAAKELAAFLLASPDVRWSVTKGINSPSRATIIVDGELLHTCATCETFNSMQDRAASLSSISEASAVMTSPSQQGSPDLLVPIARKACGCPCIPECIKTREVVKP